MFPLVTVAIAEERDVVLARQRVRAVAELLGFESQDQVRIATALSEIARNAFVYAGGGRVEVALEGRNPPQVLIVKVIDSGRGIADVDLVLSGAYRSPTGLGVGIIGARRLMDGFDLKSTPSGTTIVLKKILPRTARTLGTNEIAAITAALMRQTPDDPVRELQRQNQELLGALEELRRRQTELVELNRELEDTNRGVVALYAELDQRAEHLRRADDLKRRFLSNMSHEFRTPLHSIIGLSRLLSDRVDGDLTPEQEKQVLFVDRAARELLMLVDDLLDLAKVEAGRTAVHVGEFAVSELFGALRGMLKPLLVNDRLQLVIEDAAGLPLMNTDEGKVSQILRNLIANAIKFTRAGEVRVSAQLEDDPGDGRGPRMTFRVSDTGIGIAREDFGRIFEEFGQVDGPVQRMVKGTGLGLPLSHRLAALLGGELTVDSELGKGSTFTLRVPITFITDDPRRVDRVDELDPARKTVLVVEDESVDRFLVEKHLRSADLQPISAASCREARALLRRIVPAAIVLDVMLRGEDSWSLLAELKADERTRHVPVFVATQFDDGDKAASLGADAFARKPLERGSFLSTLERLIRDSEEGLIAARGRPVVVRGEEAQA